MKYLFDNCISPKFAPMLAALGIDAETLRDRYPANIDDVALFRALKDSHLVFITADRRQRTRVRESRALKQAGVTALWFGPFWSKKVFWDQARWLVHRWPTIDGYAKGAVQGTCAEIRENGKAMAFTL